ncbi:phospholipid/cholesterol/gamma-HCH transport system permease protein [Filimonas lacunae]|uniref:Phospholipid/cholesterol/gamma-HCH transport system permease protein n=1 Tax=Filimonas lacunae TaxID=477680 RepID=A0A173MA80_9BACT|nr:ABC transporter permease [Filimonas lacunae]BAV04411.1 ABC transporter protein [Filimonas lacunae]SIT31340.1 phospholipid/cholesterol/gamma-HCH transport system permease protein [Filimonas lacunae]
MKQLVNVLTLVGRYILLVKSAFGRPENFKLYWQAFIQQCEEIGLRTFWIVIGISAFLGMVTVVQTAYMITIPVIPKFVIGMVARDSVILELAPTGIACVLSAIVGFRIASEIGYMRLSEQIDAQEIMGINTKAFIILPRILAGMYMIPLLMVVAVVVSLIAGGIAGVSKGILTANEYHFGLLNDFKPFGVTMAFVKIVVFSFLIPSISGFMGYYAKGDELAVTKAATQAVTINCILILIADFIITSIMLNM